MALTKYKRDLLTRKESVGGQFSIEKDNVLALCQEHGKIPLLAFAQTRMQLLSEVGHRSIIIVCFILKLQQHDGRVV